MHKSLLALGILVWFFTACNNTKSASNSKQNDTQFKGDSLLVSVERSPCFGACPEYKLSIYKSGFAILNGSRNIAQIGNFKGNLSLDQLSELVAFIRENKIEDKDSIYVNKYLADFPAFTLYVSDIHPTKKIFVNHEAPPKDLDLLKETLNNLLNRISWTKTSDLKQD
jgi:hypothetical protein